MKAKAEVTIMSRSLTALAPSGNWYFSIRRLDDKEVQGIGQFHNTEISSADVVPFIPNWRTLEWKRLPISSLTPMELIGKDAVHRIHLVGYEGKIEEADMLREFTEFMNSTD